MIGLRAFYEFFCCISHHSKTYCLYKIAFYQNEFLVVYIYDLWFVMYHVPENIQDLPPEWWGHKFGFIAGGMLGAESRRKKSLNDKKSFNEEDQENLYKLVQV